MRRTVNAERARFDPWDRSHFAELAQLAERRSEEPNDGVQVTDSAPYRAWVDQLVDPRCVSSSLTPCTVYREGW